MQGTGRVISIFERVYQKENEETEQNYVELRRHDNLENDNSSSVMKRVQEERHSSDYWHMIRAQYKRLTGNLAVTEAIPLFLQDFRFSIGQNAKDSKFPFCVYFILSELSRMEWN